jgi:hypothetical protein
MDMPLPLADGADAGELKVGVGHSAGEGGDRGRSSFPDVDARGASSAGGPFPTVRFFERRKRLVSLGQTPPPFPYERAVLHSGSQLEGDQRRPWLGGSLSAACCFGQLPASRFCCWPAALSSCGFAFSSGRSSPSLETVRIGAAPPGPGLVGPGRPPDHRAIQVASGPCARGPVVFGLVRPWPMMAWTQLCIRPSSPTPMWSKSKHSQSGCRGSGGTESRLNRLAA